MNRICTHKITGNLIEMQSGGYDNINLREMRLNTLKQNAINAGYKEDEIEVKFVTDSEWVEIQEANKPVPTYADKRRTEYPSVEEQLDMIYWDAVNGTKKWQDARTAVKNKYPKG